MFVVLEGLDGAGKSTQIRMLRNLIESKGHVCEYLHFPRFDAPVYGELIARFLRGELGALEQVNPYLVALLYAGDRADAAKTIRGWLSEGKFVIADRYVYSNVGYQCAKVESAEDGERLKQWILDTEYSKFAIPKPDLSIFLDVPFDFTRRKLTEMREGDDRGYLHGGNDIHESSLELQQRVRNVYLQAAKNGEIEVVDCSCGNDMMASAEVIFSKITRIIENLI